jgi:hypothetical protein
MATAACNDAPLPIICIHTNSSTLTRLIPSLQVSLGNDSRESRHIYRLSAVTYVGANHFTARIFFTGHYWDYDGIQGMPISRGEVVTSTAFEKALTTLGQRVATHFIYTLIPTNSYHA